MRLSRNKPQYPPRMISSFLKLFRSNLAVYLSGERILIGSQAGLLAKESTCVALHAATRRVLAVGSEAQKMKGKEPGNITVVQPFQGGAIHDFDIAEAAFRYFLKKHAPRTLIAPRIVVCGQLKSETAKRALKDAFTHAGAREILLLETSMAAAIGIGLKVEEANFHVIMNLERDWMEMAVMTLAGVAARASKPIGFADLLQDISIFACETLGMSPNLASLEESLRSRGFDRECELIGWEAWIDSLENGREAARDLDTRTMAKACAPTLLRIREAFKEMLEQLPKEKRSLVANATIHLTGDYSSVPGLAQLLEKRIQRSFKVSPKSDEAAYHGTASILQELNELLPYVSSKGQ